MNVEYRENPANTTRPLRVLAVIEGSSITGPVKNLLEFAIHAREGRDSGGPIEVTLATFRRPENSRTDDFLDSAERAKITCMVIHEKHELDFSTIGKLRRLALKIQPDIVQTHGVKSNFLYFLSCLPHRNWIAWHHGYTTPTAKQRLYNQFNRVTLRFARRVITVTKAFVEELKADGVQESRIEIISNAIPEDWIDKPAKVRVERSSLADESEKIILAVGRLSREKAHADILEALALMQAADASPQLRLVLVGEGPERPRLEKLASKLGVKVTMVGQVSDVRPYFQLADIFVLSSHSEGSPNVLIEAMAAGKAIVATAIGGVPETVAAHKEALLVPPGQPKLLADALRVILRDSDLAARLALSAKARAREFLPVSRASRITTVYRKILELDQ